MGGPEFWINVTKREIFSLKENGNDFDTEMLRQATQLKWDQDDIIVDTMEMYWLTPKNITKKDLEQLGLTQEQFMIAYKLHYDYYEKFGMN